MKYDATTTTDCLRACIATLLELDPNVVPDFTQSDNEWLEDLEDWAQQHGYRVVATEWRPMGVPCIAVGVREKGTNKGHAIVLDKDGCYWHDPHPSRGGLATTEYYIEFRNAAR